MTNMNSKLVARTLTFLVLLTLIAGSVFDVSAQRRRRTRRGRRTVTRVVAPAIQYYTVPTNTVIRVRINEALNSGAARIGDRFTSNVVEPVYGGNSGIEVVPVGSRIGGRVTQVNRAGKRTPGNITVAFDSITLPNGRTAVINGSLTTLQADNVNADNESTVKGGSNRKRDVIFIGGGAATGAIIGAIAGGGKGAAIGAASGAGAGALTQVVTKGDAIRVPAETILTFKLDRPLRVDAAK